MNSDMRIWNYTKLLQARHDSLCLLAAHLYLTLLEQTILSMPERGQVMRSCSRQMALRHRQRRLGAQDGPNSGDGNLQRGQKAVEGKA
jgi:hypothetical protein